MSCQPEYQWPFTKLSPATSVTCKIQSCANIPMDVVRYESSIKITPAEYSLMPPACGLDSHGDKTTKLKKYYYY